LGRISTGIDPHRAIFSLRHRCWCHPEEYRLTEGVNLWKTSFEETISAIVFGRLIAEPGNGKRRRPTASYDREASSFCLAFPARHAPAAKCSLAQLGVSLPIVRFFYESFAGRAGMARPGGVASSASGIVGMTCMGVTIDMGCWAG